MEAEELSFEEAYEQLEGAVAQLERGGLSLEESLAQFERGVQLANLCDKILERAELRVKRLKPRQEDALEALESGDGLPL